MHDNLEQKVGELLGLFGLTWEFLLQVGKVHLSCHSYLGPERDSQMNCRDRSEATRQADLSLVTEDVARSHCLGPAHVRVSL